MSEFWTPERRTVVGTALLILGAVSCSSTQEVTPPPPSTSATTTTPAKSFHFVKCEAEPGSVWYEPNREMLGVARHFYGFTDEQLRSAIVGEVTCERFVTQEELATTGLTTEVSEVRGKPCFIIAHQVTHESPIVPSEGSSSVVAVCARPSLT